MGLLKSALLSFAVLSAATGCYSPDLRDCTVSCTAPTDCAGDQVCNANGLCAAEGATCTAAVDAPTGPQVSLHVMVMGKGKVTVDDVGACDSQADHGDCMWVVAQGHKLTMHAVTTDNGHDFMNWVQPLICGSNPSCNVTPYMPTNVVAKFK